MEKQENYLHYSSSSAIANQENEPSDRLKAIQPPLLQLQSQKISNPHLEKADPKEAFQLQEKSYSNESGDSPNDNNKNKNQAFQLKSIPSNTGLPSQLKSGIENLSGFSLNDVNVHYNSLKPAQLQAHAYAQGTDIHLGSGQEKHLPHEAWHVVQQKQGRVQPTMQMKGAVNVNDDAGLESEADVMGAKALESKVGDPVIQNKSLTYGNIQSNSSVIQKEAVVTPSADTAASTSDADDEMVELNEEEVKNWALKALAVFPKSLPTANFSGDWLHNINMYNIYVKGAEEFMGRECYKLAAEFFLKAKVYYNKIKESEKEAPKKTQLEMADEYIKEIDAILRYLPYDEVLVIAKEIKLKIEVLKIRANEYNIPDAIKMNNRISKLMIKATEEGWKAHAKYGPRRDMESAVASATFGFLGGLTTMITKPIDGIAGVFGAKPNITGKVNDGLHKFGEKVVGEAYANYGGFDIGGARIDPSDIGDVVGQVGAGAAAIGSTATTASTKVLGLLGGATTVSGAVNLGAKVKDRLAKGESFTEIFSDPTILAESVGVIAGVVGIAGNTDKYRTLKAGGKTARARELLTSDKLSDKFLAAASKIGLPLSGIKTGISFTKLLDIILDDSLTDEERSKKIVDQLKDLILKAAATGKAIGAAKKVDETSSTK